jgi:prefoldin subunit 5
VEWYAQRIKTLEAERDRLKSDLDEALERIGRLEQTRTEAVNRIDWVLDSLHNVLETGA